MPRVSALCNAKLIYVLCIMYYIIHYQDWVNNKTSEYIAKNVHVEKSQKFTNYLAPHRENIPEMKTLLTGRQLTYNSNW